MTREQYEELKARANTPMSDNYKFKALEYIKKYNNTADNTDEKMIMLQVALDKIWDYNSISAIEHETDDYPVMTYRVSKGRLHYDFIWKRR